MMPGDKVFKTKELSGQIGSARLSFGSPEEMEEMLDCHPGSASVMGLMNDRDNRVRLLVDRDVLKGEFVGAHPCINTSSLKLRTEEVGSPSHDRGDADRGGLSARRCLHCRSRRGLFREKKQGKRAACVKGRNGLKITGG